MIYCLPGMGAGAAMYKHKSWQDLPDSVAVDWPSHLEDNSLTNIAKYLVEKHEIADGDIVIGTSMGGMTGCEIARLRKLDKLILVSSARHRSEISRLLQKFHPIIKHAPLEFMRKASLQIPNDLTEMFARHEPAFIRDSVAAIFGWEGLQVEVPIARIHGRLDVVIPPPKEANHYVNGGHLITMTHAERCADGVRQILGMSQAGASKNRLPAF